MENIKVILPCPCCGAQALLYTETKMTGKSIFKTAKVMCPQCYLQTAEFIIGGTVRGFPIEFIISQWNRRS